MRKEVIVKPYAAQFNGEEVASSVKVLFDVIDLEYGDSIKNFSVVYHEKNPTGLTYICEPKGLLTNGSIERTDRCVRSICRGCLNEFNDGIKLGKIKMENENGKTKLLAEFPYLSTNITFFSFLSIG